MWRLSFLWWWNSQEIGGRGSQLGSRPKPCSTFPDVVCYLGKAVFHYATLAMATTRTQPRRKDTPPQQPVPSNPELHPVDDEFDKLLKTEESMELLKLMGDEAVKAYYRGETEEGGFG